MPNFSARGLLLGLFVLGALCALARSGGSEEKAPIVRGKSGESETAKPAAKKDGASKTADAEDEVVRTLLSGKVVLLTEALKHRGIKSYEDEIKGQVVLVTRAGELVPIVPDWRGRALYQDERLRDRAVDLIVNRRAGLPWVQVLSIYTFDEKGVRNLTDYWCDICAIPMYEI
ncbi:MAG TPA: hypothetical protein VL475_01090, partial [Planctomycetaceae bacterium]|nr:hypothetical protein [Planctomycetaceae bacterium]